MLEGFQRQKNGWWRAVGEKDLGEQDHDTCLISLSTHYRCLFHERIWSNDARYEAGPRMFCKSQSMVFEDDDVEFKGAAGSRWSLEKMSMPGCVPDDIADRLPSRLIWT